MNPFNALGAKVFGGLSVVLLVAIGWLLLSRAELQRDLANEQAAHSQTKANVALASATAQAAVLGNLTSVASKQEKVNEERLTSLRDRLARAERLRAKAKAPACCAAQAAVSGLPLATESTPRTTEAPAGLDLDSILALIRYDELITWVEQTHAIPTSPSTE